MFFSRGLRRDIEYMALAYPERKPDKLCVLPVLPKGAFRPNADQIDTKKLAESDEVRGVDL